MPSAIEATLRPYQTEGFHFLAYLSTNQFGGVLADDMGLGKTLQALTWLAWLREKQKKQLPSLVIAPKSVQENWGAEVARFYPKLRTLTWKTGEIEDNIDPKKFDLLIINYAQLRNRSEHLKALAWNAVIVDEAQNIKNPTSQSAQVACALNSNHRLALTGTPIQNKLEELWSLFDFAMPGFLDSRGAFRRRFTINNRVDWPAVNEHLKAHPHVTSLKSDALKERHWRTLMRHFGVASLHLYSRAQLWLRGLDDPWARDAAGEIVAVEAQPVPPPELLAVAGAKSLDGFFSINSNWPGRKHQDLVTRFKARTGRPWMTSQGIDGYGQIQIYREALEKAGVADRRRVADQIRRMDSTTGAAEYFSGPLKWDERGRRIGAGLVIAQWQGGQPVPVYPASLATHKPIWPGAKS
jgi:hypothetical protein